MVSIEIQYQLLDLMLKIRQAEEKIVEVYTKEQTMRTPTHLSIGQEAVAAGLALALQRDDQIFVGHRCHAAYLAKGGNLEEFFGELCGRASGICGGRAGSAHLSDHAAGIYASPILSSMIPVAVGAALAFKMDGTKQVAVAVFGDAAVEEGVFAESLNFAVTQKLPVFFLCENNLYSTHSPLSVRQPPSPIFERIRTAELETQQIDGNDAVLVYECLSEVVNKIRQYSKPYLVECLTYRIREHVGPLFDDDRGYRTKEEVEAWMAKCPIEKLKKQLVSSNMMSNADIDHLEQKWKQACDQAYTKALAAPWPSVDALCLE